MAHIWKTGGYFFPLLYICLLCDEVLLPWNFCSPGFDVRAPQDPPNMKKKVLHMSALWWGLTALKFSFTWVWRKGPPGPPNMKTKYYFFHILGLNLRNSYQIASLFHMYIDMGERIAGEQDRPSLIIEDPLRAPKIYIYFYILAHKWKPGFQIVSPYCT